VISVEVRVKVKVRLRIRLRDRDWVISDATNYTTSRSRDQFSSTRGTTPKATHSEFSGSWVPEHSDWSEC
jgi:hypothetical protein